MKLRKLFSFLVVFSFLLVSSLLGIKRINADESPITHKAEIVPETVTFNGEQVEATGYIAFKDVNGNQVIVEVGGASSVSIDTDLVNNNKLKTIYEEISNAESLTIFNDRLDSVAQSLNKEFNASVFVVTDLFEITLSDELKTLLDSDESYYYSVQLDLETSSSYKPVVMHQNEETGEWILVDSENVSVNNGSVSIKFDDLCPVMVLTVDEDSLVQEEAKPPYLMIILLAMVAFMVIIYLVAVIARKKSYKK